MTVEIYLHKMIFTKIDYFLLVSIYMQKGANMNLCIYLLSKNKKSMIIARETGLERYDHHFIVMLTQNESGNEPYCFPVRKTDLRINLKKKCE